MSQEFHGSVGQVAAGDIHNYGFDELAMLDERQLRAGLIHSKERLSDVRKRMFINPIAAWYLVATIVASIMVITGKVFSHSQIFWCVLMFGLVVPRFLYIPIARKYGPMVSAYRDGIARIEFVLHSRGWD